MPNWDAIYKEAEIALVELVTIQGPFEADAQICRDGIENADPFSVESQFWRRSIARLVFAHLEAVTYRLKLGAYALREAPWVDFSWEELAALQDRDFIITEQGKVKATAAKQPMLPNFRFAVHAFARAVASDYTLDLSTQGWEDVKKSVAIRDRITHPKTLQGLSLTVEETAQVYSAGTWVAETISGLMRSSSAAKMRQLAEAAE